MKISNMISNSGNPVANQFIIEDSYTNCEICNKEVFQSYNSIIVERVTFNNGMTKTKLDRRYWDYSVTTSKYRNQFLGETKKETQAKIDSGEYILTDLNEG